MEEIFPNPKKEMPIANTRSLHNNKQIVPEDKVLPSHDNQNIRYIEQREF